MRTYLVVVGGSWSDSASGLRASLRLRSDPSYRLNALGFRLVRSKQ